MIDIDYHRASTVADALRRIGEPGAAFVGGGTNLLDLMKAGVANPRQLST
jgi:xanthine dehydrogenase YagS FAD-binding subunit